MRFGSVCSGIEAASVAWHPLGWKAAWLAEIEPFPSAVLKHHYPDVPNLGDMTTLPERIASGDVEAPDLFCGGTPCQAFSVAGLRKSLDDARGNLSLTFCEIANAIDTARLAAGRQPCIVFWENVPGVLNTKDNAFGCFLGALAGSDSAIVPPGRWEDAGVVDGPQRTIAWRTLDAQYFGLAQRRRRVFVVASAREGLNPAEVLLEFEGLRRDFAPSREAGQAVAGTIEASLGRSRGAGTPPGALSHWDGVEHPHPTLNQSAKGSGGVGASNQELFSQRGAYLVDQPYTVAGQVCPTLRAGGNSTGGDRPPGTDVDTADSLIVQPFTVANCLTQRMHKGINTNLAEGQTPVLQPIAFPANLSGTQCASSENISPAMGAKNPTAVAGSMQVRRLTPVECERLQGFPDNYTAIPWRKKPATECPDGPRYKALGNSWAVPCVRWIGERIHRAANDNHPTTKANHVL